MRCTKLPVSVVNPSSSPGRNDLLFSVLAIHDRSGRELFLLLIFGPGN